MSAPKRIDDAYSLICPKCDARYGEKIAGPRWVDIVLCPTCDRRRIEREQKRLVEGMTYAERRAYLDERGRL